MTNETYMLSNGVRIPRLGLGTWEIPDDKVAEAVRQAVKIGYRHIDTAQGYGNERGVGEGIRTCGLKREEIFVTTKLEADIKDYDGTQAAIEGSLDRLGLDYIDLMIIHAPQPWKHFREADRFFEGNQAVWCALEKAYKAGRLRAIGLSNFQEEDIKNILTYCEVRPMVNQILAHVSNTPFGLIDYCHENNILVEAYSPMGHGVMLQDKTVGAMAERYGVSIAQLCIRYCLQLGLVVLPKTSNTAHMQSNACVDFEISAADMQVLKDIPQIKNYGEWSIFPVYGGKANGDGTYTARDFH
ncbi:MAG: aldo/keto reductase [Bacteroidales bacterium]|nr:aldo/keto reductase [Bacteroidales bacterium]